MAKKYFPALIISAAILYGIGYQLKLITAPLSRQPAATGIEAVVEDHSFTKDPLPVAYYHPTYSQPGNKSELLSQIVTEENRWGPLPEIVAAEEDRKNYWSSFFQQY